MRMKAYIYFFLFTVGVVIGFMAAFQHRPAVDGLILFD